MYQALFTKTNYEYVNKELTNQSLLCQLCKEPLVDPVRTDCIPEPHSFCRQCIEKSIKTDLLCPVPSCNKKIHREDLTSDTDTRFLAILNGLPVRCLGCEETGLKRGDLEAHYNGVCPKISVACPSADMGCSWRGTSDEHDEHFKICVINSFKPVLGAFQGYVELSEGLVKEQGNQIETLQADKRQLEHRLRQRTSFPGPVRADRLPITRENNPPSAISAKMPALQQIIEKMDLKEVMKKLDKYQGQVAMVVKDRDEKDFKIIALQDKVRLLESQLEQSKKNSKSNS